MKYIIFFLSVLTTNLLMATDVKEQNPSHSLEPLLRHNASVQGFSSTPFWKSMKWKRDDSSAEFCEDRDVKIVEQNFVQFCQAITTSPTPNYRTPPTQYSIPPILHFIWLGSVITPKVNAVIESWKNYHPGWEIKVWTDKEMDNFAWSSHRLQLAFEQAETWAEKADILRLEVLYQFGGIYSDASDVVCLNSFHDLIVQNITFFSCFELNYNSKHYGEPFYIGTAVMGAIKGSPLMKYCLDHCRTHQEAPEEGIIKRTGPGLVSRACQAALLDAEENILILPCSYIYPLPFKNKWIPTESILNFVSHESLAIHLWDGSWCK